jgi:mRNA interferase HigB
MTLCGTPKGVPLRRIVLYCPPKPLKPRNVRNLALTPFPYHFSVVPNLGTVIDSSSVRVIARSTLREFVETLKGTKNYAPVKSALDAWFHEVQNASWKNPAELKLAYASASILSDDRVVFNIKGNAFRLVVAIDYLRQVVFIKWLGSHAEYDRINAVTVKYAGKTSKK